MFNRKKEIVIGETYIFDVLNETNLATEVTLVTVIKRVKRDIYAVIAVNNGYVFETHSKYLTPYISPETARVVRCQYGTTEFSADDLITIRALTNIIEVMTESFKKQHTKPQDKKEYERLKATCEAGKQLGAKIKTYVDISTYKNFYAIFSNAKSRIGDEGARLMFELISNDVNNQMEQTVIETELDKDFKPMFDEVVERYIKADSDLNTFIDDAINTIKECFPIHTLLNTEEDSYTDDDIFKISSNVMATIFGDRDCVSFIVAKDDEDTWYIEAFYREEDKTDFDVMDSIVNFLEECYPEAIEEGEEYIPKYKVCIFTIPRRKGDI